MYTTFDKTIVGIIMGGIALANLFGFHFGLAESTVTGIVGVITPFLVYLVPNLPKDV
jgi:hypothetical protein